MRLSQFSFSVAKSKGTVRCAVISYKLRKEFIAAKSPVNLKEFSDHCWIWRVRFAAWQKIQGSTDRPPIAENYKSVPVSIDKASFRMLAGQTRTVPFLFVPR